jgi:GNAT superfamily N-acetyltransferase
MRHRLEVVPPDANDVSDLASMVVLLYEDDPGPIEMTIERAQRQVAELVAGKVLARAHLLRRGDATVGYAILVPFWSNEFGGTVLVIDELYVRRESRGTGVGTAFFEWVKNHARAQGCVRLFLEVNDANEGAGRVYRRAGFELMSRYSMMLTL